mmetsp:Transcript_17111/g.37716  ORF Transcript_17111/g.37716 Transcript_17111/m.37716 type:complete len:111 (+) Transcript_17111:876-1208(+)
MLEDAFKKNDELKRKMVANIHDLMHKPLMPKSSLVLYKVNEEFKLDEKGSYEIHENVFNYNVDQTQESKMRAQQALYKFTKRQVKLQNSINAFNKCKHKIDGDLDAKLIR